MSLAAALGAADVPARAAESCAGVALALAHEAKPLPDGHGLVEHRHGLAVALRKASGVSETTWRRCVDVLEAVGLVAAESRPRGGTTYLLDPRLVRMVAAAQMELRRGADGGAVPAPAMGGVGGGEVPPTSLRFSRSSPLRNEVRSSEPSHPGVPSTPTYAAAQLVAQLAHATLALQEATRELVARTDAPENRRERENREPRAAEARSEQAPGPRWSPEGQHATLRLRLETFLQRHATREGRPWSDATAYDPGHVARALAQAAFSIARSTPRKPIRDGAGLFWTALGCLHRGVAFDFAPEVGNGLEYCWAELEAWQAKRAAAPAAASAADVVWRTELARMADAQRARRNGAARVG